MRDRAMSRQLRQTFEKVQEKAVQEASKRGHTMGSFSGVGLTASADCRRCNAQLIVDASKQVYAGPAIIQTCGERMNQGRTH